MRQVDEEGRSRFFSIKATARSVNQVVNWTCSLGCMAGFTPFRPPSMANPKSCSEDRMVGPHIIGIRYPEPFIKPLIGWQISASAPSATCHT